MVLRLAVVLCGQVEALFAEKKIELDQAYFDSLWSMVDKDQSGDIDQVLLIFQPGRKWCMIHNNQHMFWVTRKSGSRSGVSRGLLRSGAAHVLITCDRPACLDSVRSTSWRSIESCEQPDLQCCAVLIAGGAPSTRFSACCCRS
eukprot:SAG11_NODE_1477_length_4837_cov_2.462431_7_plen_144_part_00